MDQIDGEIQGNTKRISASKRWCFTLNNYSQEEIDAILEKLDGSNSAYVFQEEEGDQEGTPHIQGYIEFEEKKRAGEFFHETKRIHWEKCKGSRKQNIKYCTKYNGGLRRWFKNLVVPKQLRVIRELRPWQQEIVDLVVSEPDDRTIHWYWEPVGGIGKSCLVKYLCAKYNCLIVGGKGADMKYLITQWEETHGDYPTVIIFDIPRTALDYISWTGLEEVKNGCFASTKYECKMVIMNSPHLICFANAAPQMSRVSADRWAITRLGLETEE